MATLLAVDPGTKSAGAAWFKDGELVDAVTITRTGKDPIQRAANIARDIVSHFGVADRVVFEYPEAYPGSKIDPNKSLFPLILIGGAVWGAGTTANLTCVLPKTWKGQLPKDVCHRRIDKRLSAKEKRIWRWLESPDAKDAVGIGLWALSRF